MTARKRHRSAQKSRPADAAVREEAARGFSRNLVVTAGAGTGKTSLLVERMLHQVLEKGTPLERMAAITFTAKAAAELRDRVEDALEQVLELAAGRGLAAAGGSEAERVFERLDAALRDRALERSRAALESLDTASVSTIHGFAGDLLRRHCRAAGVDVKFEVDDGRGAAELFDDLWPRYVTGRLGPAGAQKADAEYAAWQRVLDALPMASLENLVRHLTPLRIPLDVLGEKGAGVQSAHARIFAGRRAEKVRAIRGHVGGRKGLNRNLLPTLDSLQAIYERAGAGEDPEELARTAAGLPQSCTVGKNADVAGAAEIEAALKALIKDANELAASRVGIVADLEACLGPFLSDYRREYLRRGFVSYDGLIVLARDLLRENPAIRRAEASRLDCILIDEFQDTDPLQYEIFFFLAEMPSAGAPSRDAFQCRLSPGRLFIVGDAKQSIYHFRGADIRAYAEAVRAIEREGGSVLTLSTNFRSVPELVDPINDLFEKQFASGGTAADSFEPGFARLVPHRKAAARPTIEILSFGAESLLAGERRRREAEAIASLIREGVDGGDFQPADVAILLSTFSELDTFLRALRGRCIDYAVDGGKGFYRRYEIELLLAFLRVLVNPADSISLVACLRSPVCAVEDRELQLHAARCAARHEASWMLGARVDPGECPALERALSMLRRLHDRHRGASLERLAGALLEETPFRLAMAASYEGGQRIANIEKAAGRIAQLAADGRRTGAEILELLQAESAGEEEGDSPLADETVDAVRVLTIHKAKGLQWPIVILPDLARKQEKSRPLSRVELARDPEGGALPAALAFEAPGVKTPAALHYAMDEVRHREAESKRLLYVAMTRARDRLLLLAGPPPKGGRSWVDALAAWGYSPEKAGTPEAQPLHGGAVLWREAADGRPAAAGGKDEKPDERLLEAAAAFRRATRGLAEKEGGRIRSPSSREGEPAGGERGAVLQPPAVERAVARAAGTAVHLLLEIWDREDAGWLRENAPRAARVSAAALGVSADAVAGAALAVLEKAEASGALERLAAEPALSRELPVLFAQEGGDIWDGTIDLVAGTPDAPEVVDFKTSVAARGAEDLQRIHAAQLDCYAEGVRRALGLDSPPPVRVEPL